MAVSIEEVHRQIHQLGRFDFLVKKKEIGILPDFMRDGEQILLITTGSTFGSKTWIITATQYRLIFLHKGMFGLDNQEIHYDTVNSVSSKLGMLLGDVELIISGKKVKITYVPKEDSTALSKIISDYINNQKLPSQKPVSSEDVIAQLERLTALKEKDALSEEEFITQKNRVLENNSQKKDDVIPENLDTHTNNGQPPGTVKKKKISGCMVVILLFVALFMVYSVANTDDNSENLPDYKLINIRDISYIGMKRFTATTVVPYGLSTEDIIRVMDDANRRVLKEKGDVDQITVWVHHPDANFQGGFSVAMREFNGYSKEDPLFNENYFNPNIDEAEIASRISPKTRQKIYKQRIQIERAALVAGQKAQDVALAKGLPIQEARNRDAATREKITNTQEAVLLKEHKITQAEYEKIFFEGMKKFWAVE